MANPPCPCTSGLRLHACCGPYLSGASEPPDAEALMRSRFAAYATGNTAHLWRTLDAAHPDRAQDEATWRVQVAKSARAHKYRQLTILDRQLRPPGEASFVLFHARIFQSGRDVSFLEASEFRHHGTGWRYLRGQMLDPAEGWEQWRLDDAGRVG